MNAADRQPDRSLLSGSASSGRSGNSNGRLLGGGWSGRRDEAPRCRAAWPTDAGFLAPPSIRACGSHAHGSPTFFTVGIQRPVRHGRLARGATMIPLRSTSPWRADRELRTFRPYLCDQQREAAIRVVDDLVKLDGRVAVASDVPSDQAARLPA